MKYKAKYLELKAKIEGGSKYIAYINDKDIQSKSLVGNTYKEFNSKTPDVQLDVKINENASQIRNIKYNNKLINYVLLNNPSLSDLMTDFVFNIVYDDEEKQKKYNLILNEELQRTTDEQLVEVLNVLVRFLNYAYIKNYYDSFLQNVINRLITHSVSSKKTIFTDFIKNLNEYDKKYSIKFMTDYLKKVIGEDKFNKILTLSDKKLVNQ